MAQPHKQYIIYFKSRQVAGLQVAMLADLFGRIDGLGV